MEVNINLYCQLDYLVHTAKVESPLKKVYVWGKRAFQKVGKRKYREVSFGIITDTVELGFKSL